LRSEKIIPTIKRKSIEAMLKRGERLDGRKLDQVREISIETNFIEKAEGSALVRIGKTMVVAGVKLSLGSPFPDAPDKGVIIVNTELIPIASPVFEPGPPGEEDVEIARVVDRGIRSSNALDLSKLSIIPGKRCWIVYVDIYALNHDGNLMDACALAAVSALLTAKKKRVSVEGDSIKIVEEEEPLPMKDRPVFITIGKIGDNLIVDPNYEEELIMDSRITFAITEDGKISAIQKGEAGYLTCEEVINASELAFRISKEIRKLLPALPKVS